MGKKSFSKYDEENIFTIKNLSPARLKEIKKHIDSFNNECGQKIKIIVNPPILETEKIVFVHKNVTIVFPEINECESNYCRVFIHGLTMTLLKYAA